jgi:hypothetical protein
MSEPPASEVLRSLAARAEPSIPLGEVIAAAGSRVHGLAILLFALPEALPLPLPSASAILGVPLLLVSAHLAVFGERAPLPSWIQTRAIPRSTLAAIARHGCPALEWFEQISRPRWTWLARQERLVGLICFCLSLILFLPFPLMNLPSALSLALLALGTIQRDGFVITLGIVAGLMTIAALAELIAIGGGLLAR